MRQGQIEYILWLILVGWILGTPARADTLYVSIGGNDAWTGVEPNNVGPDGPKATVQAAINAAEPGDVVVVAAGVYRGPGNHNIDFLGKAITVRSSSGPRDCIIDCEYSGRGFHFHRGEYYDSVLEGFTVTRGFTAGGGILCYDGSSPKIIRCILSGNSAVYDFGGGIAIFDGSPILSHCIIENNTGGGGGGILCFDSSPLVTNCNITHNATRAAGGGILCFSHSEPRITNCIVWGNTPDQIEASYGNIARVNYSVVQDGWWGSCNLNQDPLFAFGGDCHLAQGSCCIDAGTNTPPAGLLAGGDLDGNVRPLNGGVGGWPLADIGVYEFNLQRPSIALSASSLEFFLPQGGTDTQEQVLGIRNCGGDTLAWTITEPCDWLEVDCSSGTSTGDISEVTVRTRQVGLPHGDHVCQLRIADDRAVNSPRFVPVTLHVNAELGVPDSYPTIQAAMDDAVERDVVLVAEGIHSGPGNRDLDFRGKAITVRGRTGPEHCIIDCEGTESEPHRGFYFHSHEGPDSLLDGLTIINGYAPMNQIETSGPDVYTRRGGGAVFCSYGSPVISNCWFFHNVAEGLGGAVFLWQSGAVLDGCLLEENSAAVGGGVGSDFYGEPSIRNCILRRNTAFSEEGGFLFGGGGGIYSYSATEITNCVITENASQYGGGICTSGDNAGGGALQIRHCTFWGNTATYGAAMYCGELSSSTATNCIFWNNQSQSGPPIVVSHLDWGAHLTIKYSDVQGLTREVSPPYFIGVRWGQGNIEANPRFVSAAEGDFRLARESPCIDAGCNAGVYEDRDQRVRPWDCPWLDNNANAMEFDMGAYEFQAVAAKMKLALLGVIPPGSNSVIKARLVLPRGYTAEDVDSRNPAHLEPLGIASEHLTVQQNEGQAVVITLDLARGALCGSSDFGPASVYLVGQLSGQRYYYGTANLRISHNMLVPLAVMASHWLESDCGKPYWCQGADMNHDRMVNLFDLALLDGCCLEVLP
ncbi:MAG: right-handed parallel beta-helix repeat-containing protein [Sedimentisphaerales bacterium]|nr:right-handed parallel beta-helix repeat-containing protein [Sedimentisphaerales bacterium]